MPNNRKTTYFKIGLMLLPFLALIGLEFVLWLFNAFPEPPLMVETSENGRPVLQLNPYVATRYFPPESPALPTLYPETFAKEKSPETFRIFCLGGSSTAGFPFDYQVPFPKQLSFMLSESQPDKNIEVINLGLSAINSFSVLDLLPEVLAAQPDLVLIYMGHNEFYGVYGSASAFSIGQNGGWIRFYLKLQKFRITRMLKSLIQQFAPAAKNPGNDESLMSAVIGDRAILYESDKYRQTLSNFSDNLNLILEKCQSENVPVILGDLITNEKDLPPFASSHKSDFDETLTEKFDNAIANAELRMTEVDFISAKNEINLAIQMDSSFAKSRYLAGKIYLQLGDSLVAARLFRSAKDLDVIRFRASSDINRIIRETGKRSSIPIAEVGEIFEQHSPDGIVGAELVCDHLHPNPNGYFLMAKAFFWKISDQFPEFAADSAVLARPLPYFVTGLDWEIGLLKIHKMTRRWPFPKQPDGFEHYTPYLNETSAKIANNYINDHKNWARTHFEMADVYEKKGDISAAINELKTVMAVFPKNPEPLAGIARIYKSAENWEKAAEFYQKVTVLQPNNGMAHYQLAMIKRQMGDLPGAVSSMQNAAYARDFSPKERINAQYYLAGFLLDSRKIGEAQQLLRNILKENPNFSPAIRMLQQISAAQSR